MVPEMRIKTLQFLTALLVISQPAVAQARREIPLPGSQGSLPIAAAVWAGNTLYVSGWLDPDMKTHHDVTSQTVGILKSLQALLESQKLTMGDVAMVRVYLGSTPVADGKPSFDAMMEGYSQFFGTTEQPNKPARTTVQVVLPAAPRGALVEIDLVAVRP